MSHGGGSTAQPSCTTMPLGKSLRRALRAAIGMQKKKPKDKPKMKKKKKPTKGEPAGSGSSSTELISSFSDEAAARKKESVVRVVLSSGVVEVYPGVVLACTVIRKHPPGLCLAHPDVFRNPHGAVVRPLEPLFPGQKLLLIPWSTVDKLKQKIPESSIGAFADDDDEDTASEEEEEASPSSSSTGTDQAAAEEDEAGDLFMPACSAREYFVARDRWSECRFRKLVAQGLAVEPSADDDNDQPEMGRKDKTKKQKAAGKKKKKKKKRKGIKGNKKRREQRRPAAPPPAGSLLRAFATARLRTWEPSLPPVVEEEDDAAVSPLDHPSETEEASSTDMIMTHEQYVRKLISH